MAMNNAIFQGKINMTPMIDVLLVLLITFMVITPLAPKGYLAQLPSDSPIPPPTDSFWPVVEIRSDGGYSIDRRLIAAGSLDQTLRDIFGSQAEKAIFLKASGDLEYQAVVPAMVSARAAGIDRIGLLTK